MKAITIKKLLAMCATTLIFVSSNNVVATEVKNNVLVLMFDDMRFDTFSYRGGPVNTPNIDALASESVRFDNAMTTTGLCSPSRAAFFTGRWGHKNGLDDNVALFHSRLSKLPNTEGGIIKRAADKGYMVGYVGKWHLGHDGPKQRGAEFTKGKEHQPKNHKVRPYTPYGRPETVKGYNLGKRDENGEKKEYFKTLPGTYKNTKTAKKVKDGKSMLAVAANDSRPFFGVISFHQPHPPYKVPEPYASMYDSATVELPKNHAVSRDYKPMVQDGIYWPWHDTQHMTDSDWRKSRSYYYGAIAMVDRAVGEIIETTKALGLYEDLHIVLIGDQGSMLGEHSLYDKGPYAYEELMRMPLLIKSPNIKAKTVKRQVSMIDLAPTLAEIMDVKPDGDVDGHSLIPLMKEGDKAEAGQIDSSLYAYEWYNGSWFGIRAVRTPDWKFVWYPSDSRDELYDLNNDSVEMKNLISSALHVNQKRKMVELLADELMKVNDPSLERLKEQYPDIL